MRNSGDAANRPLSQTIADTIDANGWTKPVLCSDAAAMVLCQSSVRRWTLAAGERARLQGVAALGFYQLSSPSMAA